MKSGSLQEVIVCIWHPSSSSSSELIFCTHILCLIVLPMPHVHTLYSKFIHHNSIDSSTGSSETLQSPALGNEFVFVLVLLYFRQTEEWRCISRRDLMRREISAAKNKQKCVIYCRKSDFVDIWHIYKHPKPNEFSFSRFSMCVLSTINKSFRPDRCAFCLLT